MAPMGRLAKGIMISTVADPGFSQRGANPRGGGGPT